MCFELPAAWAEYFSILEAFDSALFSAVSVRGYVQ